MGTSMQQHQALHQQGAAESSICQLQERQLAAGEVLDNDTLTILCMTTSLFRNSTRSVRTATVVGSLLSSTQTTCEGLCRTQAR